MLRRDKFPWCLSFFIGILLLAVSFLILWLGVRNRLDIQQPLRDTWVTLSAGKSVGQSFTATNNFVNVVILHFKNPGLANKGELQFSLQSEDGAILVERQFSGYNIGDPSDVRFQFEPLLSSKNKKFIIVVKSLSPVEPQISIGASNNYGLSYSVYYRTVDKKTALVGLLRNFGKRFFEDKSFCVFWALIILATLSMRARQFKKN